jgi:tRNA pseudouridine38-40 synthase
MSRFKVYLEYEGTRYSGWQVQKNARTVQGELLEASQKIFNTHQLEFYGAGRTDAGVHALRQVAHLDVQTMLAPEIIRMKINDELPADINVLEVEKAAKNFHARHDAEARSYVYQISRRRTAFAKRYVWWVKDRLELAKMEAAAKHFLGMKNFESFTADDPDEKSTKVQIDGIEMKQAGELILIRISGSHFLWKMVRQMVGILAEVGRGNMAPAKVAGFLAAKSGIPAKYTAPPSGLFLERVYYKGDGRETPLRAVMDVGKGA